MSYALSFYVFTRILGIAAMIVAMGVVVDRYLIRRHFKRANG